MQDYTFQVKRTLGQMGLLLLVLAGGAGLTSHTASIPGLALGTAGSVCYYLLMCYRIKQSAGLPPARAIAYMRIGWLVRLSFVVLILILSLKMPQIDFLAAVMGLFSFQVVIILNAAFVVARSLFSK
ncbi:MAG: ATP synthase subunit I [Negativicutes bacterium]|nr:ATP synthase subunit I [Negativicutes bacterium]